MSGLQIRHTGRRLRHSAEMVLCFKSHLSCLGTSSSQGISGKEREPTMVWNGPHVPSTIVLVKTTANETHNCALSGLDYCMAQPKPKLGRALSSKYRHPPPKENFIYPIVYSNSGAGTNMLSNHHLYKKSC